MVVVIMTAMGGAGGDHGGSSRSAHASGPKVPPYYTVQAGDTMDQISQKTDLSVGRLEAYNPDASPMGLIPGERLNLWAHPPKPRPKPPGPMFWTVQPGQSFGWIAAATGINLTQLEQLNHKLASGTLQPGERVRLRT